MFIWRMAYGFSPKSPNNVEQRQAEKGSMAIYLSADLQINVFCGIWTFIILFLSPMNGIGISTPFTTIYHCRQNVFGRRFKDTLFRFTVCKWASSSALATCKISAAIYPSKSLGHGQNWRLSDFKYLPAFIWWPSIANSNKDGDSQSSTGVF